MQVLIQRLQAALAKIQKNHPQAVLQLNEGSTQMDLDELASRLNLRLPESLEQLYLGHDGQHVDSEWVFNREAWLSLQQMEALWEKFGSELQARPEQGGLSLDDEVQALWWHEAWLPFSDDGHGNHLCVDLVPTECGQIGQIIRVCHDEMTRSLEAESLEAWLESHIEALEESDYVYSAKHGGIIDAEVLFEEEEAAIYAPEDQAMLQEQWQSIQLDLQQTLNGLLGDGAPALSNLIDQFTELDDTSKSFDEKLAAWVSSDDSNNTPQTNEAPHPQTHNV